MAVSFVAEGAWGITNNKFVITPALPTGWAVDDMFLLVVHFKLGATNAVSAGWTNLGNANSGSSHAVGLDTGDVITQTYYRQAVAGDVAPTLTITNGNVTYNGGIAQVLAFRCPSKTWVTPTSTSANITVTTTAWSVAHAVSAITVGTILGVVSGWMSSIPDWTATPTFTLSGSTFSPVALTKGTIIGNSSIGGHSAYALVNTAGSGTTATIAHTMSATSYGGMVGFTIKEVPLAAPTVTSLSTSTGTTAGGTATTITGTGFTSVSAVTFGGVAAASFTVTSSTTINTITPAGTAGAKAVAVTTPGGTGSLASGFTYTAPPAVTAVSPVTSSAGSTTAITVTGTGFTGATGVTVGGTAATAVTVVSATSITCTTPALAAGSYDVLVTNGVGTSAVVAADKFAYTAIAGATPMRRVGKFSY